MKTLFLAILSLLLFAGKSPWLNNLDEARQLAKEKREFILLNFSGSDWCGPCMKMHEQIFETDIFRQYADSNLILVNADFPRLRKNQLPQAQQRSNDALADKYNSKGIFPYTLLLDTEGKVLKTWQGYFDPGAESFVAEIKNESLGRIK